MLSCSGRSYDDYVAGIDLLPSFTAILQYFSTSVYIAASAIWEIRRKPPDEMRSPMGNAEDSNFEE